MADVSSTLKLESGKRYRWVHEGPWEDPTKTWGEIISDHLRVRVEDFVSIEPLPDPEPKWKHGAVVHIAGHQFALTYNQNTQRWHYPNTDSGSDWTTKQVSKHWSDGTLEILYTPED